MPDRSAPPPVISPWTPTAVYGIGLTLAGFALGAWAYHRRELTLPVLCAAGLLIAAGMLFVDSPRAREVITMAREIAPDVAALAARRALPAPPIAVAPPADTDVVVARAGAPDVVVPAAATGAPPSELRASDHPTSAVAALALVAQRHDGADVDPDPTTGRRTDAPPPEIANAAAGADAGAPPLAAGLRQDG